MDKIQPIDLNKKTVFILGAGASKPYGFPLGTELKTKMIENLSGFNCQNALFKTGFDKSLVDSFNEALRYTYYPTIDIFLEKKKKFRSIGAYLIAFSLIPMEYENILFPQKDWYAHIYHTINFEYDTPNINNIVFVSLNYDRSLEHFLFKNIQVNCPDELNNQANLKLENLKIIHAHGSLGRYPLINYGGDPNNLELLQNAAERIRITSDKLEDSVDFIEAQTAINEALNLVFIGFGYDPTTLKLLTKGMDLTKKRILGTIYQIKQDKLNSIQDFFNSKIDFLTDTATADDFIRCYLPLVPHIN
jgi:hypothetical protein